MPSKMPKAHDQFEHARLNAKAWFENIEEMVAQYAAAVEGTSDDAGDGEVVDAARQTIEASVLSVQVRDGWRDPSSDGVGEPVEYEILLSTGGPALRIVGQLDDFFQPTSAEMQMQDWGTPWTRYPAPEETLLAFASGFWFGE